MLFYSTWFELQTELATVAELLYVWMLCRSDFLPRGSGIVTRRPLVLQLINAKQGVLCHLSYL